MENKHLVKYFVFKIKFLSFFYKNLLSPNFWEDILQVRRLPNPFPTKPSPKNAMFRLDDSSLLKRFEKHFSGVLHHLKVRQPKGRKISSRVDFKGFEQ